MGNIAGALHSLLPKIYLQATPHGGGHASAMAMDKCLQALQAQRKPLIDSCTHEHPLLSCTARTYQRLMEGALSQRWWPLRHDEKGTTVGSINLGYKYDSLMHSLQCAAKDSCLEKSLANLEQKELTVSEMEKSDQNELARLEQLQCAFAGSRIDKEDGEKGQLPVFTDKIWAAGLKAHAWSLENDHRYSASCPSMVPFVVAFCAEDLKCMDADKAGEGMLPKPLQFEMVTARARKAVQELSDLSISSVHRKEDLEKIATFWDKMAKSRVWELTPDEDIYQWNLLWRAANASSEAGVLSTWPTIVDALMGRNKTYVDWTQTTKYWQKVLEAAFVKMRVRTLERKEFGEKVPDGVEVDKIMTNLNSIFDTKFCSPGALGGMHSEDLQRMGVSEEAMLFVSTFAHERSAVVRQWKKWMVFNIKLGPMTKSPVVNFKQALQKAKCGCMCYDSCGKKEASAFVHCSAGLLETPKELLGKATQVASLFAKEVLVDWVFAVGRKFENALLRISEVPRHGACGYRFSMNAEEVKDGEKDEPKRKRVTLSGFVSECEVPDFFELSPGEDLRVTVWSEKELTKSHLDWALQLNGKWEDYEDFSDSDFEKSDGPSQLEDGIEANDELAFLDDLDMGEVEDGLINDLDSSDSLETIDLQEG